MSQIHKDRKAAGLCQQCGKVPSDGRSFCPDCARKREVARKILSDKARSTGFCINCFHRTPDPGRVTCRVCIQRNILSHQKRKAYPGGEE